MESTERLAQPDGLMFERNVGHIAKRGREVEVWIEGIPDPRTGFLAGLDDEYVQLCLTKTQALSNIRRDHVISIDETGRTLGTYLRDTKGTDEESAAQRVKERVINFKHKAMAIYGEARG